MSSDTSIVQALPGLETYVCESLEYDRDPNLAREYTGEQLLARDPARYAAARRALFELRLSKRSICKLLNMHFNTLAAIEEREIQSRPELVESLRARARVTLALVQAQGVEAARELFLDKDAVASAGLVGVAKALSILSSLDEGYHAQADNGRSASSGDEYGDVLDVLEDGLDDEKKGAADSGECSRAGARAGDGDCVGSETDGSCETVSDGSSGADRDGSRSLLLSNNRAHSLVISQCVAKSVAKQPPSPVIRADDRSSISGGRDAGENLGRDEDERDHAGERADTGAGGCTGERARPCGNKIHSCEGMNEKNGGAPLDDFEGADYEGITEV